ncbi:MAG: hypothetical protein AAGB12_13280 [Pseudomonadota bacterium]
MNKGYEDFFDELESILKAFSSRITMPSTQFDEITNLKDCGYDTDSDLSPGTTYYLIDVIV